MLDPRRKGCLTGTDMAILLGQVPEEWGTPLTVYNHKVLGLEVYKEETESMEWGRRLEDAVAQKFLEQVPHEVLSDNQFFQNGIFGGTPDRVVRCTTSGVKLGVEVKTTSDSPWNEPPLRVLTQVHTYMLACPDVTEWWCAALFTGNKYRDYCIEMDPMLIARIQEVGNDFWVNHVLMRTPPEEGPAETITYNADASYIATEEEVNIFKEYLRLTNAKKAAEEALKPVADRMKGVFKDNKRVVFGDMQLDYPLIKPKPEVDTSSLWQWAQERLLQAGTPLEEINALIAAATTAPNPYRRMGQPKEVK